jgi:hypothetical protein
MTEIFTLSDSPAPTEAALQSGLVEEETLDRALDPTKMAGPPVTSAT